MTLLPGATIGIFGGGQLGLLTALAARAQGYSVVVLDPDPQCAAAPLASRIITAPFDDCAAGDALGRSSSVVTYEIERIAPDVLRAAQAHAPVRPSARVLETIQSRIVQKRWLRDAGFSVGAYEEARDHAEVIRALTRLGGPCIVKGSRGGYDGRGQVRIDSDRSAEEAMAELHVAPPYVVEKELPLEAEFSVLVARSPGGETVVYPPARNWHQEGILEYSVLPGDMPSPLTERAQQIALEAARRFELEGVLVIEFFWTGKDLFVNEMAPRPHNSYHTSEVACVTSQFEQLVRAICDLPLGSPESRGYCALINLLGDLWMRGRSPNLALALSIPGVQVRMYGKVPRPHRKVGHLLAYGHSLSEATQRGRAAFEALTQPADPASGAELGS